MKFLTIFFLLSSIVYGDIKWINPSWSECEESGGKIPRGEKTCIAQWSKAKDICKSLGARLPKLDELTNIIKQCGGIIDNRERNSGNQDLKICSKQKGFLTDYFYWSSNKFKKSHVSAWGVNFDQGYAGISNKYFLVYVRCVREKR